MRIETKRTEVKFGSPGQYSYENASFDYSFSIFTSEFPIYVISVQNGSISNNRPVFWLHERSDRMRANKFLPICYFFFFTIEIRLLYLPT